MSAVFFLFVRLNKNVTVPGRLLIVLLLFMAGGGCGTAPSPAQEEVVVFAAASLVDAVEAVADSFETAYPRYHVVVNPAGTSLLARQIAQGARADVFFSASREWVDYLAERGRTAGPVAEPFGNRLVVVGPPSGAPQSMAALADIERLGLADPAHVPAGLYAKQALQCAGLWRHLQPAVVSLLDVRAALLAAQQGAVEAAIVYASDVQATPGVHPGVIISEACQPEIRYALVRLRQAPNPEGAALFLAYASRPERLPLWAAYGFMPNTSVDMKRTGAARGNADPR